MFEDLNNVQRSQHLMQKKVGQALTRAIKRRYNQIISFTSFLSLLQSGIGKVESLEGNFKGFYSLRVSANFRLIIKPKAINNSAESLGQCDTLIIKGVLDYHEKGKKQNWLIP